MRIAYPLFFRKRPKQESAEGQKANRLDWQAETVGQNLIEEKTGNTKASSLDKAFSNTQAISADVDAAYNPNFPNAFERNNSAYFGRGMSLVKYTGARGKSGASDANAEFVAWVRSLLEENNIRYQIAELGRVDLGGGGTIAYILANKGMDVIDCGVPVLSMHAPYEVISKIDLYSTYLAYKCFIENI